MSSQSSGVFREYLSLIDSFVLKKQFRETSNKALDAVNKMYLAPFLMSFVAARGRLLTTTVVSAGKFL